MQSFTKIPLYTIWNSTSRLVFEHMISNNYNFVTLIQDTELWNALSSALALLGYIVVIHDGTTLVQVCSFIGFRIVPFGVQGKVVGASEGTVAPRAYERLCTTMFPLMSRQLVRTGEPFIATIGQTLEWFLACITVQKVGSGQQLLKYTTFRITG